MYIAVSILIAIFCGTQLAIAVGFPKRLTVEIGDNDFLCLHEDLKEHISYLMGFEVVFGGQFDIDVTIKDPKGSEIYRSERKMHDTYHFNAKISGTYIFCLNNEFSSLSHKHVYFELTTDDYESLGEDLEHLPHAGPISSMENDINLVHIKLSQSESLQVELKNRELTDRLAAENLNFSVLYWSLIVASVVIIITMSQTMLVKNFFSDRKTFIPRSKIASRR